jgi:hypothetical protein
MKFLLPFLLLAATASAQTYVASRAGSVSPTGYPLSVNVTPDVSVVFNNFTNQHTYTLPAHTLTNIGDTVNKQFRIKYGSTTVWTSPTLTNSGVGWKITATFTRTGNTNQVADVVLNIGGTQNAIRSSVESCPVYETNGIANVIALQSFTQLGSSAGCTNLCTRVTYQPAP